MGMFDTLSLDPPVACPRCGKLHADTQTKHLSDTLTTWKVGQILRECPVTTGILREQVHCCRIGETNEWTKVEIFLVVWHGVYAGHGLSEDEAIAMLSRIDRLDLLTWLDKAQQETREWKARFRSLQRDVQEWVEEQKNPRAQRSKLEQAFGAFHALPDEILKDPDPLARILERNDEALPVQRGYFGD